MQPAATWHQDYWWPKMAKKMKPLKPGKARRKSMGGSSLKLTKRQKEALRRLNQDFNW